MSDANESYEEVRISKHIFQEWCKTPLNTGTLDNSQVPMMLMFQLELIDVDNLTYYEDKETMEIVVRYTLN